MASAWRTGGGVMGNGIGSWAVVMALCLAASGCQSAPAAREGAATPMAAPAQKAAPAKADKPAATRPEPAVVAGEGGTAWRATASGPLGYAQALAYCRELPPHQGNAWRLPSFYELARGPLGGLKLPEDARLWTDTAPERLPLQRLVIDPQAPFVRSGADLREGPRFHALCMASPAP